MCIILTSDMKTGSSFLAFLQITIVCQTTKIPVIDSVNNDVESKIDFGTAKPSHKKSKQYRAHVFTRNLHFLPVDSPSRDSKRNFVQQKRQNVTQFCCTCYHNCALFSHPMEDNKTILDKKRVQ